MTQPQPISTIPAYSTRPGTCPECNQPRDEIAIRTGAWRRQFCESCQAKVVVREAEETRARHSALVLELLNVPAMYKDATLDNFALHGEESDKMTQARVLRSARRYVSDWPDDVPMIVIMSGGFGTGKGHLCWSILKEIALLHLAVARFTVLPDVVRDLRASWHNEGGPSEAARLRAYRLAPLLVIDEVSRHAFYGEPSRHLYDLVAWREQREKPTIITSNERGAELVDLIGSALTSRVLGWGGVWDFGSRDYRTTRHGAA